MKPLTALYALVTFLSAFLLFLLEPIAARQLLPLFGGSAAVWTTCLVFFQCALLAGYLYAHLSISRLGARAQTFAHIALLTAALLSLEVRLRPSATAASWHPAITILGVLTATIGLPFVALAATTPLLQAWYAKARGAETSPWWLFALSNTGSLLALFLYPTVVEPGLALHTQIVVWGGGFCVFMVLCGALALNALRLQNENANRRIAGKAAQPTSRPTLALWVLLPACGSMLLCAITNHLGENIAAIPLLWIVPLAAYLLSFVVAFASPRAWPRFISVRMLALTLAIFAYLLFTSRSTLPLAISIPVYILAMFFGCLFCHSELYRLRPLVAELTSYYLLIAFGSAIGAIFIGVAAPNLFDANYDLAITVIVLAMTAFAATWRAGLAARLVWAAAAVGLSYIGVVNARNLSQDALVQLRSFYGSLRVTETHLPPEAETTRTLFHGHIQHGTQMFGNGLRMQPASYYGHNSGLGLALDFCCAGRTKRVGVVGLGTGTVAVYGKPGDDVAFYEINPLVERLARALFTYLRDSPATVKVVLGDARLSLAREAAPGHSAPLYDVLVLDAFSGDAIPIHLLTAQAIALYRRRLTPQGVLVFHISSQYLDLAPELALQARNAGLQALLVHTDADEAKGLFASDWVLMSADDALLRNPEIANAGKPLPEQTGVRLWTDDYSSLLPLLKWRGGASAAAKP
jgi:spermidine synthase